MTETEKLISARVRPGRYFNDETHVPRRNFEPGMVVSVTPEVFALAGTLVEVGSEEEAALAHQYAERGEMAVGLPVTPPVRRRRKPKPQDPAAVEGDTSTDSEG